MRFYKTSVLAAAIAFSSVLWGAPTLIPPPSGQIGNHLEAFTAISLSEPSPAEGLEVTLTSDNSQQLLFATAPDQKGEKTLTLKVAPRRLQTPDFYIQALAGHGLATYTVSAPGYTGAKGAIEIVPSAITITGPSNSSAFHTTVGGGEKITARPVLLDEHGNVTDTQPVAGGLTVKIDITSSDPKVGSVLPSTLVLTGGASIAAAQFKPSGSGSTLLSASVPEGFRAPAKAGVAIEVNLPGIGMLTEIQLGKDLQVAGWVLLGDDAPAAGLDVTLTSDDPSRLLLSATANEVGSKCLKLHVPGGQGKVGYYLQGLADSGTVGYTAEAQGYRTRHAIIGQTPSGFMVVFAPFGAPDEGEVLHPMPRPNPRPFFPSLSDKKPLYVSVWSVYLDPTTLRGADITAQAVRAGVTVPIELKNSDPSVAKVAASLLMSSKGNYVSTEFVPLKEGETTVSVVTPKGFTTPSNATSVTAVVGK